MDKAWAPVIRKAGFTFTRPKLVVVLGQDPASPCDFRDGQAYYCGDTIHLDAEPDLAGYRDDPEAAKAWMAYTISHEYGHHVQVLTGMSEAVYRRALVLNGVDAQLELTRRFELQAACFAGVYLGAARKTFGVTPEWLEAWYFVIRNTTDPDHDHGNAKNHRRWTTAGFTTADPAACNTYPAPSKAVS